ncbi:MAG: universal stress protein [Kofleriaceae bacterium]
MIPTSPSLRRFRIVVALDDSEYAEIVLEHGIDQAARHERPDLHFVTVPEKGTNREETRGKFAGLALQGLETMGTNGADWRSWLHVLEGEPEGSIAEFAADIRADLIVIGRFGVHHRRGSTADRLLVNAPCPTLVVNLKQDDVPTVSQCPACVAIRAETDAERLFCDVHVGDRVRLSSIASSSSVTRGGSVW